MRFLANGPSIPDDLLMARDAGDVIFFCGAGVSRHKAGLPDFLTLGENVISLLGASEKSLSRKLFKQIRGVEPIDGVGGLVATDRIFSLLEREFERKDVQIAVAKALQPADDVDLSAHRILTDLSCNRDKTVRLVTTNFDLLFEACVPGVVSSGPPTLPDPRSPQFGGIIHLHGRVNEGYTGPCNEEFIVSSGDFGRAYLSDGWATRFIQSLLARFQIVFVGYAADDPPVQYLLEALNLNTGNRSRLFAFQPGGNSDDAALWEHRGVQAIPFDSSQGFGPLWGSLEAWAKRARDIDGWYANLLTVAMAGPAEVDPHVRGQIAHALSTREGTRHAAVAADPLPASWLLTLDSRLRYQKPGRVEPHDRSSERIDPYERLALDSDTPPQPIDEENIYSSRELPKDAWNVFTQTRFDQETGRNNGFGDFCGDRATMSGALGDRLGNFSTWFIRIAHQPIALWWAAGRGPLHPSIVDRVKDELQRSPDRWPEDIRRGWRMLIAAWSDYRGDSDQLYWYRLKEQVTREGWSESLVRDYAELFRPNLKVERGFGIRHPLFWTSTDYPNPFLSFNINYLRPNEEIDIPRHVLGYTVTRFRENLDLARSLHAEISGDEYVYMDTTRADDGAPPIPFDSYGVTGLIAQFQSLMRRLVQLEPDLARAEIMRWPVTDHYIFARLRIWAAASPITTSAEAAEILLGFPDEIFWGSQHQRDILYAIRDRWVDFSTEKRMRFEKRLLTTTFPWSGDIPCEREVTEAHYRLDRLHWLTSQQVTFSFDAAAEMKALHQIAKDWSEDSGQRAGDSHVTKVRSIDTDTDPSMLEHVPINEILNRAKQASLTNFHDFTEQRPFTGLAKKKPVRALAVLSDAARKGDTPSSFWSAFLYVDERKRDPVRLVYAIAGRLASLPPEALSSISYPVSEWLLALGSRVFDGFPSILDRMWQPLLAALALRNENRKVRIDDSWASNALNAPVGKLVELLLMDPTIKDLKPGQGFPQAWTTKLEQLLGLPGDMRRHALVMLGYQLNWVFEVAPEWAEPYLLSVTNEESDDGDALWDGISWAARTPRRELYERLKPGLVARVISPTRRHAEAKVTGAFLLLGWGGGSEAAPSERLLSNAELREILIQCDNELRSQILWHIQKWQQEADPWRKLLIPFLTDVWPNQRALRTPEMSARLSDLALASGDLFPQVVIAILPRLTPVRGGMLINMPRQSNTDDHPARHYPMAMLDLLWAILAEDLALWPYEVKASLDLLSEAPETRADPRLSELRRRRSI